MSKNDIYSMIGKKLAGEMSQLESQIFDNWLKDAQENREMFRIMEETWKVESHYQKKEKGERLYSQVMDQIELENAGPMVSKPNYGWMKYAAAVSALLIFSALVTLYQMEVLSIPGDSITYIEKTNPKGQKSKIHLPDGSVVMLNAGSTLKYPNEFDDNIRELDLIGEAYFEVAKDKVRPFVVTSAQVSTTALGTAFNVKAFPEENIVEVALTEGEVKVSATSADDQEYYLSPGERVQYDKNDDGFIKTNFAPREVTSWKNGIIYFRDASMKEVFSRLEMWYDVKFKIQGKTDTPWTYSGEFQQEYLTRVLQSISYSQDFEFEINDKNVSITF